MYFLKQISPLVCAYLLLSILSYWIILGLGSVVSTSALTFQSEPLFPLSVGVAALLIGGLWRFYRPSIPWIRDALHESSPISIKDMRHELAAVMLITALLHVVMVNI